MKLVLLIVCGGLCMAIAGCDGCDEVQSKKGKRAKTSMAGQPEEYQDPSRLDAKSDQDSLSDSLTTEDHVIDTMLIEINADSLNDSAGTAEPDNGPASGPN